MLIMCGFNLDRDENGMCREWYLNNDLSEREYLCMGKRSLLNVENR